MRVEVSSAGGWHWNVKYDVWLVGTASWPNELLHTSTSCGGTCTTQLVYTVPRRLALACRGYSRNILLYDPEMLLVGLAGVTRTR